MNRPSRLRGVWIRRFRRALPALLVVGGVGLALAIDLRYRAARRLVEAEEDFAASFGREALAGVRASLDRPPQLARRLTAAAGSDLLGADESKRLVRLAIAPAPPGALDPWGTRCERLIASMDRAHRSSPVASAGAPGAPTGRETWRSGDAMMAINSLRACGLAAAAQGERATAMVAAELLGALARGLEAWPQRLSLMIGVFAERGQLDLFERLRGGAGAQDQSRLLAALSGEDLARRHRDAIAGEVIYARDGWLTRPPSAGRSLEAWYLGPFEAGAYIRALTRYLRADARPPSWPDSEFADARSQQGFLEHERSRQAQLAARREAEHRALADTASGP